MEWKKKKKEKKENESGREWESIPCLEIPHEGGREGKEETEAIVWQISVERDLALFYRRSNEEGSRLEEGRLDLVISWRFGFLLEADEEQPPSVPLAEPSILEPRGRGFYLFSSLLFRLVTKQNFPWTGTEERNNRFLLTFSNILEWNGRSRNFKPSR